LFPAQYFQQFSFGEDQKLAQKALEEQVISLGTKEDSPLLALSMVA
jgi:hypothetical protein